VKPGANRLSWRLADALGFAAFSPEKEPRNGDIRKCLENADSIDEKATVSVANLLVSAS
jgi:hypothetical protein